MSTTPTLSAPARDSHFAEIVRKTLDRADCPLSANAISKQLTKAFPGKKKTLEPLLEEMVARGEIQELPKFRGAKQYWTRDLETYAREEMLRQLSQQPLTRAEVLRKLEAKLRGLSVARREAVFKELVDRGDVQKIPRYLGTAADRFSTKSADPRDYLIHAFEKVREKLTKAGIPRAAVEAAACEVVQRWNREPAPEVPTPEPTPEPELEQPVDLRAVILARMQEIEPRAAEGAMVSIPELRRAMEFLHANRLELDEALWDLIRSGRLAVHRHDHPYGLSDSERGDLLQDQAGHFYNGLSIRISS